MKKVDFHEVFTLKLPYLLEISIVQIIGSQKRLKVVNFDFLKSNLMVKGLVTIQKYINNPIGE